MPTIAALLRDPARRYVEQLWRGQVAPLDPAYPMLPFLEAEELDLEAAIPALAQVARATAAIEVHGGGFAVLPGAGLSLPVVRTEALGRLHRAIWNALWTCRRGTRRSDHPDLWFPAAPLSYVRGWPAANLAVWDGPVVVDNLALILAGGEIRCELPLVTSDLDAE